jgi:hypothetical protein
MNTHIIVNRECEERGCMAYDDRVDGPGIMVRHKWVGLTDDDLMELPGFDYDEAQFIAEQKFARAIEAKLKEKNTVRMRRATRDEKIINPGVYWVEDKE